MTSVKTQPEHDINHLKLGLLGSPIVQHAGHEVTFRTRKALALLIYLAVEGGVHSRDRLAVLFWPESDQSKGRAALRSTLAYLRNALQHPDRKQTEEKETYLIIERDALGFNVEANFEADWLALQTAWLAARSPVPGSDSAGQTNDRGALASLLAQLQAAASLYRGDFLTGFSLEDAPDFDDWASTQRETCHRQMGLIFDRLSQLQAESGEFIDAIETASRWVALDPLSEVAHRRLIQLHFAAEDRSAALQAYEACRAILTRELNAAPSPETEALADRIRMTDEGGRMKETVGFPPSSLHLHPSSFKKEFPLVGRTDEHLALVSAYRTMRRGQPQVVTLEGEPGIGKSRLAKEFLGWAMAQGADVLQGRAFEASGRLPYQALVEALRDRLEQENAPDDLLSDLWLAELSRLLPELRDRYPDLPRPTAEETTAPARLFEAVTRLGQALSERTPLVLFLDDLQWADVATLDLLQYAVRRWAAANSPVLLLFTLRSEALEPSDLAQAGPGLSNWLWQLRREVLLTRLTLKPLLLADIRRLAYSLATEVQENSGLDTERPHEDFASADLLSGNLMEFSQRLFTETGGQPFFLVETLKMLFEPQGTPPDDVGRERFDSLRLSGIDFEAVVNHYLQASDQRAIPPNIQEMIGARLARLSPAGQMACLAAAVLGNSFDFERLGDIAGLSESDGLAALEELLKHGLLRQQRQPTSRPYVLAHDYFREVIYYQAAEARRRILHRRAFESLEAAGTPPAELARHAWAAGLLAQALDLNIAAGHEAMRLYAPQAAIEHFTRALAAAQQLAMAPPAHLYRTRGQAYETTGDFERAQADFEQALNEAQSQADRQREWQALQDLGFLWASRNYTRAGDYFKQALALARTIAEPAMLARSLNRVGNWHANIEQPAEALDLHREALTIFRDLADHPGQAETLDLLGMASYMNGEMQSSLAYYDQAIALFRELDQRRGLVSGLAMMSMVIRSTFTVEVPPGVDLARSVPVAESAVQMAREIGWRAGESHALLALGQNLSHQGQYGLALQAIQSGLAVAGEIEHPLWLTYAYWLSGLVHLDLLALPLARQQLERALGLARETGSMFWLRISTALLALTYIRLNEYDRAESVLAGMLGARAKGDGLDSVAWPEQTAMQRLIWYAHAELALACGEPRMALQIVEQLIAAAPPSAPERPALRLSKLRGEALTVLGRTAEAEAALREAQAAATTQDEPPLLWRIHLALSRLYQAQGQQAAAAAELAEAQAIIDPLAATIPDETLRDNFRRSVSGLRLNN